MRRHIRQHVRLPKRLLAKPNPIDEAVFYAKLYKKAVSDIRKRRILDSCMANGGHWDIITRSISYYNIFEHYIGEKVYIFWGIKTPPHPPQS